MRIAYITAGAAGMYCGSCMRDNTLAAALIAQGHDCLLIPTYTPVRTDEKDVSLNRVFFGGINVYLEQKSRLFRRMPAFLDRILSMPRLLRWVVSKFGMKTKAEDLCDLTLSMLRGLDGFQRQEVLRLVDWLAGEVRPDLILLTNALLSGMVPELTRRLGVPVVCTLQGDDIFLEMLPEDVRTQAIELIRDNCRDVPAYIVTSRFYADFMAGYLGLPRERMHVVYPGINLAGYSPGLSGEGSGASGPLFSPRPPGGEGLGVRGSAEVVIGYLARIAPEKGLHILVDAFGLLQKMPGLPSLRLRAAGYLGEHNRAYLAEQRKKAEQQGWADRFEYIGEVDHQGKIDFLHALDLFSVPSVYREPKGLYLLEAWAAGVPAVQPRHGSFPELIEATGGGILVEPNDAAALAEGLRALIESKAEQRRLGDCGREAVQTRFRAGDMAAAILDVLQPLANASRSGS